MLKIKRVIISRDEIAESWEYTISGHLKYYIYSYKVLKRRKWITLIRWDNLNGMDHVDIYDESGNLVKTEDFPRRSFDNIVKIISTFRKNIIAMDLKNL